MTTPHPFAPRPLVLTGRHVRLVPLTRGHLEPLLAAGTDPELWRWMPRPYFADRALASAWVDAALAEMDAGRAVVFATCAPRGEEAHDAGDVGDAGNADGERGTGDAAWQPVGSTRFFDIQPEHRALEIGWTWIGTPWQRSAVNTEAKLLMLTHAFEALGALRVQLKTDSRNARSRAAMERIGCQFEGVLRNHMLLPDGSHRHSAFYSVIADDWPQCKAHMEGLLARR